jgi:hypothetical protein
MHLSHLSFALRCVFVRRLQVNPDVGEAVKADVLEVHVVIRDGDVAERGAVVGLDHADIEPCVNVLQGFQHGRRLLLALLVDGQLLRIDRRLGLGRLGRRARTGLAGGLIFTARAYGLARSGQVNDRYSKAVEQLCADLQYATMHPGALTPEQLTDAYHTDEIR